MPAKSLLEVQFPIAQLSLESYLERDARTGKVLNSLGKWWGTKPIVLTRAVILASLLEASGDPDRWPEDLESFLKLMCFDNAGMWARRNEGLQEISAKPPWPRFVELCHPHARPDEMDLFKEREGEDEPIRWKPRMSDEELARREALEKRVFYTLDHTVQRRYCRRVEEIDGPPPESWQEINAYCGTNATCLVEWVAQMSQRRFGRRLRVGDAFSGMGSIPFAAAELGCDVYASDLNPVACLLSWGALNIIAGDPDFHAQVLEAQQRIYDEMERWYVEKGFEASEEGWRGTLYYYCVEIEVPEWDGWKIPLSATWQMLKSAKNQPWIELVPDEKRKRFDFQLREGGEGFKAAERGTKQGPDVVCPPSLWDMLHRQGKTENASRSISLDALIENHGGLRRWEKRDITPRDGDFYGERLYAIRWEEPYRNKKGEWKTRSTFREPRAHDLKNEEAVRELVEKNLTEWQSAGWIPDWRIQDGAETARLQRERGWAYWHHLFTPRQLLMAAEYSRRIAERSVEVRPALTLGLGHVLNYGARLCQWHAGGNSTTRVFYNQAFNTFLNYVARGLTQMQGQICLPHTNLPSPNSPETRICDARTTAYEADLWITDPPYADAVNYEELSEFFLAWYEPHLKACFPAWYTDSKRDRAVKGDDAPFRVAMAECYARLTEKMPDGGMQVLMFTHKDTDVWEDLALIMWAAGLQVKQVWSVATEKQAGAIKKGHYVQATYNMVLRKRPADAPMGFVDLVIPQIKGRVEEVIRHMRDSQVAAGGLSCGYTDTDYLLAAQAVAAEVVTGFSSIDGIDLDEELRTPNKQRASSVLRDLMNQAKRTAVDFLVPFGLEENLKRSPDGTSAYQFWRSLAPEEKFLLKSLELEAGGVSKIGSFQDLGRAYGIADYEELLGPVKANEARSKLPDEFPRPDLTRWDDVPANERSHFTHSVTRHLYHSLKLLSEGADADRAVKHLVDCTNFWSDRQSRHLVLLGYLYQTTGPIAAWADLRSTIQTLRLAVENHRA
jgi:adenine-specific DNA methylase